ncbi:uroporphyrinogen decarboxylase [Trueperella bialowiezensis]|uniref:Uroporphyrinogen decarboxylase n=1 Tax=Trueperella bialowiezensis TaxID=312285 RepID=A0A448PEQ9_9ACTO|nr:uroporphyrinogen decarboxylase [Trueperella bialowiezensis]VEI13384.1 Uroporphyrinogen decarboxylase [Trueperella bialowiezensis]
MSLLVDAARGKRGVRPPVWFMRQAGRSLPEYREIRAKTPMLEACLIPELAAEITLQPVRRHGVDAAVFFSDIVVPMKIAGIDVDIKPGVGPVFNTALRTRADIDNVLTHRLEDSPEIREAVSLCVANAGVPVIGFGGGPFTLAAYMVEGKPSRDHLAARGLMHTDPEYWHKLMTWAADTTRRFIEIQVEAGASVAQLFDSWAGSLSRADYERYVLPYSRAAVEGLPVPVIHFGTGTGHILDLMGTVGDVVGVDYRITLASAAAQLPGKPLQGNIDPAYLTAPWETLRAHVDDVLESGKAAPSHIVNLGHGVPPTTDPGVLTRIVDYIKEQA